METQAKTQNRDKGNAKNPFQAMPRQTRRTEEHRRTMFSNY